MSNLWQRIANFFKEWDGEDMTKSMPLSVDDLRIVNSQRIMLTTLEKERKEIRNKAIDEFAENLIKELKEKSFNDFEEEYSKNGDLLVWFDNVKEIVERMKGGAE